ncbi:MAG TPA: asparagine synthase-related protein [Thermoanaerobaculia bacterium]|nr:asparagine synthase-related protein [Thermoanaerobaculia bacterium]
MSAICGIVSFSGAPVETGALESMTRVVTASAPISTVLSDDGAAGFLSSGAAAVRAVSPSFLLAADARIDNREDLASAYERWGRHWHHHLWGAFAAVVWDQRARELLLLRDRTGERGLYWCRTAGGGVMFASEPAQLVASGRVANEPNRLRILTYLLDAPTAPTWTYFEHVYRVPEGHQVRLTAERVETDCYWDWTSVTPEPWDPRTAAPELARRLEEAVKRRLARQGETGVLLSGGLDSASVAAQAASALERQGQRLHAFTWTSQSGDGIDETPLSRTFIRSRSNVVEHPLEADGLWPFSRYPEAYRDLSDPESNAYPDLLLATLEAAGQQGVTILMNGIGGDPVAGRLAPELALLLRGRLGALRHRWRLTGLRHAGLLRELRFLARRPQWPAWLTPHARRQALEAGLDRPQISWRTLASPDRFRRAALASRANAAALERFDRLNRRYGVRIEAPWHDPDLASLVLGLHDRALDAAPPAKRLLRTAMAEDLPAPILQAATDKSNKSGLRTRGLLGVAREPVERLLSNSRLEELGLVTGSRLLAAYREKASRQQIESKLWEVLTTEAWLRASAGLDRL